MDITSALTSALTEVAGDITSAMTAILPIGLGITGVTIAVRKGLSFFKTVTK